MAAYDPKICVLIPAYNEEPVLEGTIKALRHADVDLSDIYVVDDRSTDKTAEIAKKLGVNVFTVPVNGGKARAQTQALEHFKLCERYDWVMFLDGDTKVHPYFFNAMYKAAKEDPSVALYIGQVKSVKNNHAFSAARAVEYAFGQDIAKQGQSNFGVIIVSPGCASMYRADVLATLYIDHMTLAEDMDLTVQVHRLGHKMKYIPDAVVYTQDPNNLRDYGKQMMRWYRGFWQVVLKHKVFGWQKKQGIDFYMMLCIFDAIIFNRLVWLIALSIIMPERIAVIFAVDVAVTFLITAYGAYRSRRKDVLYRFPTTYLIGLLSTILFLKSFFEIAILRKELLSWNKVKRYDFSNP